MILAIVEGDARRRACRCGARIPNKSVFNTAIEGMLAREVSPITIDTYARAINAFLHWLNEEGHGPKPISIPRLKEPEVAIPTLSAPDRSGPCGCRRRRDGGGSGNRIHTRFAPERLLRLLRLPISPFRHSAAIITSVRPQLLSVAAIVHAFGKCAKIVQRPFRK